MTPFATFPGLPDPLALPDDPSLIRCLSDVLHGWPLELAERTNRPPFATIERRRRGFRLTSRWLDGPSTADTPVGILTSLIVDLGYAFAAASPGRLCLHAGAVELGGRLVVFPSASKAGKSTLITALAMAGLRIFADDLLPIEGQPVRGVALGTRPRLRLPLARAAGAEFRRFVHAHAGPTDDENQFLRLPPELHARHGETAPIGAFVLLDRRRDGPAELIPAAAGEGLRRIILQSLATPSTADAIFVRLRDLVGDFPCFTLRYSGLEEAVNLLRVRFADWGAVTREGQGAPQASVASSLDPLGEGTDPGLGMWEEPGGAPSPSRGERAPRSVDRSSARAARFLQNPDAILHDVDGEAFLVHPGADGIYALDPVALLVWRLLAEPVSLADIVGVLGEAFPDAEPERIGKDVAKLLRDLVARGLVVPEGGGAKKKGAPKGRPSRRTEQEGAQTE